MTINEFEPQDGVAFINGRGEVWLFVDRRPGPYTGVRIEDGNIIVIEGHTPFAAKYIDSVMPAARRCTTITIAHVDSTGQILDLDDVEVILASDNLLV